MRLAAPTNWDMSLIEPLSKIAAVESVYGSVPFFLGSGGRPTSSLVSVTPEHVEEYIRLLHSKGLKFSYALNAACLGNREWEFEFNKKLFEHFDWLRAIGVDTVIVTIPHLMELIKNYFPELKVKVSSVARVTTVPKAKLFEKMGADAITFEFDINRDFKTLRAIRKSVNCDLEILLNNCCLYECPWQMHHANCTSHSHQSNSPGNEFYVDSHIIRCGIEKYADLSQLIKARWIRPEDLATYEEIGYDSFKISGRTMSNSWILNTVNAYASRNQDGNLLEILEGATDVRTENLNPRSAIAQLARLGPELDDNKEAVITRIMSEGSEIYQKLLDLESFKLLLKTNRPNIWIDNKLLDGFLEFFKTKDCHWECAYCDYCDRKAKEVITADEDEIAEYIFAVTNFFQEYGNVMGYEAYK